MGLRLVVRVSGLGFRFWGLRLLGEGEGGGLDEVTSCSSSGVSAVEVCGV